MQKLATAFAVLILLAPLTADAAARKAARVEARTTAKVDYNCSDFPTQAAAQKMFLDMGGVGHDIYRLDADKDGVACENLSN